MNAPEPSAPVDVVEPAPPQHRADTTPPQGAAVEAESESTERRRAGLTAVILLAAFNVADVVLTHLLLDRDAVELNPIASLLLGTHLALVVKLAIVVALAVDFMFRKPRLSSLCLLWLVTGFYMCTIIVNGSQLVAVWDR